MLAKTAACECMFESSPTLAIILPSMLENILYCCLNQILHYGIDAW